MKLFGHWYFIWTDCVLCKITCLFLPSQQFTSKIKGHSLDCMLEDWEKYNNHHLTKIEFYTKYIWKFNDII